MGGLEEQETVFRIYYVKKKFIFSFKKKIKETFIVQIFKYRIILRKIGN